MMDAVGRGDGYLVLLQWCSERRGEHRKGRGRSIGRGEGGRREVMTTPVVNVLPFSHNTGNAAKHSTQRGERESS